MQDNNEDDERALITEQLYGDLNELEMYKYHEKNNSSVFRDFSLSYKSKF